MIQPMTNKSSILQGQVALVTGGGRGIGQAIALALAAAGAKVAVAARSADQLAETVNQIEQFGGRAISFPVDVTDQRGVQQLTIDIENHLGPIDLLVNNAGIIGEPGPIVQTDAAMWWRVLDVNLRGPFLCSQAVLPSMIRRKQGRIVNVSSAIAKLAWPNVSAYAISKTALNRFSETLALETATENINIFTLDPGVVRTAMTEYGSSAEWQRWDDLIPRSFAAGHDVPPEKAAQLTVALASGKADMLSGRAISVYDNLDEMISQVDLIQNENLYLLRLKQL